MHPLLVVLHLAASVMLLLWAVRMVRTGVERAYGTRLKRALRAAAGNRVLAAGAGSMLAILLQSSTAVAILAAGFAASGTLTVSTGIAALLGADLGSALAVQILSFDLSPMIPVLILCGAALFLKFDARRPRQIGRILLGIGFVLLALKMIAETTEPLRDSAFLPAVTGYLKGDPATTFALSALMTWFIHSSVASVLLIAALAAGGVLPAETGLPLVLGANAGGGLIAYWLTRDQPLAARRIAVGNLVFRVLLALAAMAALFFITLPLEFLGPDLPRRLVNAHLLFNAALVVICLPFAGAVERAVTRLVRETPGAADIALQDGSVLDRSLTGSPAMALGNAMREVLRMGTIVDRMLRPIMDMFDAATREQTEAIGRLGKDVNRAHTQVKLFIADVNRRALDEDEAKRGIELTDFAINLDHAAELVTRTLLPLVEKTSAKGLRFSKEGWHELNEIHARLLHNLQLAMNVLVSSDVESARQLVREKENMRRLERQSHERHLKRLQNGFTESIETTDIHLEALRGMKEINSLLATAAYPILSESGELRESRLAGETP